MNTDERKDQVGRRNFIKSVGLSFIFTGPSWTETPLSQIYNFYTKRTIWSTDLDINDLESAPTIVGDTAYIAGGELYAVNARTGTREWTFEEDSGTGASAPEINGGTAYYGSLDSNLYAVDIDDGTLDWSYEAEERLDYSSPTVTNGTVYIGSGFGDGALYAIDATDGELLWKETLGESLSSPTVVDGTVYIASSGTVHGIEARTGEQEWFYRLGSSTNLSEPTVGQNAVYMSSNDYVIHSIDRQTGEENWKAIETPYSGTIFATPTVYEESVYAASALGNIVSIDTATGEVEWRLETAASDFLSSPTIANDIVYVGSPTGDLYAVDATTGELRWSYNIDGMLSYINTTEINSSPTVVSGILFIGAEDGSLYAIATDHTQSSVGSRVRYGTLGHHHTWANTDAPSLSPSQSPSSQKLIATLVGLGVPPLAVRQWRSDSTPVRSFLNQFSDIRGAAVEEPKSGETEAPNPPDTKSIPSEDSQPKSTGESAAADAEEAADNHETKTDKESQTVETHRTAAENAIKTATSAAGNNNLANAVDAYRDALTEYQAALDALEGASEKRAGLETEIVETREDFEAVKTRHEERTAITDALQPAERSLQEAIVAFVEDNHTIARIRFRQARDSMGEAFDIVENSDADLLSSPIELHVEPDRDLSSNTLSGLPAIPEAATTALAEAGIETVDDLESSEESPWTPAAVEELVASDTIDEAVALKLTVLSWWHSEESYTIESAAAVARRQQQAEYGFNHST